MERCAACLLHAGDLTSRGPGDAHRRARAPCSCRQTPLHSRHIPPAASSAVRQLRPGPGARPSSACGPSRALKPTCSFLSRTWLAARRPRMCVAGAPLEGREASFPWILHPVSSDMHLGFSGHEVLGSGGWSEWDRAQLCLAFFLSFCKSVSIIPKWPNRCHMELVKAQSHDSKEEGDLAVGSSRRAAAVPRVSAGGEQLPRSGGRGFSAFGHFLKSKAC